nr:hypothetical protein [Helicobacter pylori]
MKSVNQWFNKLKAHYQAKAKTSNKRFWTKRLGKLALWRECKVNDFYAQGERLCGGALLKKGHFYNLSSVKMMAGNKN